MARYALEVNRQPENLTYKEPTPLQVPPRPPLLQVEGPLPPPPQQVQIVSFLFPQYDDGQDGRL